VNISDEFSFPSVWRGVWSRVYFANIRSTRRIVTVYLGASANYDDLRLQVELKEAGELAPWFMVLGPEDAVPGESYTSYRGSIIIPWNGNYFFRISRHEGDAGGEIGGLLEAHGSGSTA